VKQSLELDRVAGGEVGVFPLRGGLSYAHSLKQVSVLRLDQLHPLISGNKWFKLKYNLESARQEGFDALLSCGGPHSNHLHALAAAGQVFGFKTRGLVRGYENLPLTPTLEDCLRMGMALTFVDKKTYRQRYDSQWCEQQAEKYQSYWIPEGGNNALGKQGCIEIAAMCDGYDEIWLSIGSGCTFLGVAAALNEGEKLKRIKLKGIMAIKGGQDLKDELLQQLDGSDVEVEIDCDNHLGGFGRCPDELISLICDYDALGLPLDPVYTAKLVNAFEHSWLAGELDSNKRYLLIHSGGLQGRRGVIALSDNLP